MFGYVMTLLRQTGQIERFVRQARLLKLPPNCTTTTTGSSSFKPIQYENIFTAFLLLAAGGLVAALSVYVERSSFFNATDGDGGDKDNSGGRSNGRWKFLKLTRSRYVGHRHPSSAETIRVESPNI